METTTIPGTELGVSRIAFGAEPLGGTDWGGFDLNQAQRAVHHAWDNGVNIFDTADIYGLGRSEEVLSAALGNHRHEAVIVTKFGVRAHDSGDSPGRRRTQIDCSPDRVRAALHASLSRLRIDTIPIYLVHRPDPRIPIEDTIAALLDAQQSGEVRYFGVSNFPAGLIARAAQAGPITAVEIEYSLLSRSVEDSVLESAADCNAAVLAYGALAQGLLTGKYGVGTQFDRNDRRHRLPHFRQDALLSHQPLVERLRRYGHEQGRTTAQVALRWVLDHPLVGVAIAGMKSPEQVDANLGATGWAMSASDRQRLADNPEDGSDE